MSDAALTLMQWLSPAFPVGAFAYSHGLEQVIADGLVTDADTLHGWLEALVSSGSGRADAILLAAAYGATDPAPVDQTARAFAASAERLRETTLQGAAFCQTAQAVWGVQIAGLTYPVAVGTAARLMQVPLDQSLKLYLHAFASNLVSAAQRALPLGQTDGQRLLARLAPCLILTAEAAMLLRLDDLSSSTFAADIASMRHETLEPRIFRS
jgi:urease accessory protein